MAPIASLVTKSIHTLQCALTDEAWGHLGVSRVLSDARSGRGFLQQFGHLLPKRPQLGHFFETLKGKRRLELLKDVADRLADSMKETLPISEVVKDYELYAAAGHWHQGATHDERTDHRRWPSGHVYAQNLRTGGLHHLATACGCKEHDMIVIKRVGGKQFRMREPTGTRVVLIWDRASINFALWTIGSGQTGSTACREPKRA